MLLVFLAAVPAHAVVPSATTIASAVAKASSNRPPGGVTVVLREVPSEPAAKPGRKGAKAPAIPGWELRFILGPSGDVTIERENLRLGAVSIERFPVGDATRQPPSWLRVLLSGPGQIGALAAELGVGQTTSLAREGKTILWVWGAGPRDRKRPQIHVDRATRRVVRVIDAAEDVSLLGIADKASAWGRRWPATLVVRRGKREVRFVVTRVQVTPPAAPAAPPGKP